MRLIDGDALKKAFYQKMKELLKSTDTPNISNDVLSLLCGASLITEAPTIEPERKKGKWIKKMRVTETEKYISYDPEWHCACCGTRYDPHVAKIVNFCYVCGADMRGEEDGND